MCSGPRSDIPPAKAPYVLFVTGVDTNMHYRVVARALGLLRQRAREYVIEQCQ